MATVEMNAVHLVLSQPQKRQDGKDHHHDAYEIKNIVHAESSFVDA